MLGEGLLNKITFIHVNDRTLDKFWMFDELNALSNRLYLACYSDVNEKYWLLGIESWELVFLLAINKVYV